MVLNAQDCIVSFGSMDLGLYRVRYGSDRIINWISLWTNYSCALIRVSPELTVSDRPAFCHYYSNTQLHVRTRH